MAIDMNDKTYGMMNWRDVEGIVCADVTNPHEILGLIRVKGGTLIQVFLPKAESVIIAFDDGIGKYTLKKEDESGFFALFVRKKLSGLYKIIASYEDGNTEEFYYAYEFPPVFPNKLLDKFTAGIAYDIPEYLGAHIETRNGVSGTSFALWAPEAVRVSVVGDFNDWDGRCHIMTKDEKSGVFELFIPGVTDGAIYKYEIKKKGGEVILKSDPYGYMFQKSPETATVVKNISDFKWNDTKWLKKRKEINSENAPVIIYEVDFNKWQNVINEHPTYENMAPCIAEHVIKNGYTHIELMPVMEHYNYNENYNITGYYGVSSAFGTPQDFMKFVDYMHTKGIGVILDWVPAYFPKYDFALGRFDGSALYEHLNPKQGEHKKWNAYVFNYGREQVKNFLISNGLFWIENYHGDGIRINAIASMLYLDYDREDGQWVPNIYGGKENLEAIEFIKEFNKILKKRNPDVITIAEDNSLWPDVTGNAEYGETLGFDYKWNLNWNNDIIEYLMETEEERKNNYDKLTEGMVYEYIHKHMLSLSHDVVNDNFLEKNSSKIKALYGCFIAHPGKKLVYPYFETESDDKIQNYIMDINNIYLREKALYEQDNEPEGFRWINCISRDNKVITFIRCGKKTEEMIIAVCNFSDNGYRNYKIGVPMPGKYKEIINSDNTLYGGNGEVNPRIKTATQKEWDGQKYSISINVPPLGIALFKYRKGEK